MKPLVSVIVPIYKVENYIVRCLDSLCKQSLHEIEIILVDDCSPDKCGEICDDYASKDKRFTVIHQPRNFGLSIARNTGIKIASAEYLMFVDSDDFVHQDFCKNAYDCAVHYQADLVMFRYQNIDRNGKHVIIPGPEYARGSGYKTKYEAFDLILDVVVWDTAWNKLYHKELFRTISYPPYYLYEDTGTTHKLIWEASQIYYMDQVLYYHRNREGSIMTLNTKKAIEDRADMYLLRNNDLTRWGYNTKELEYKLLDFAFWYCVKKQRDVSDPRYVYLSGVLRHGRFAPGEFNWKQNIMLIMFKYFPSLFDMLCAVKELKIK